MAAEGQLRSLSTVLARTVVRAPRRVAESSHTAAREPLRPGGTDEEIEMTEETPRQRNRDNVETSRRIVAAEVMAEGLSRCGSACVCLLILMMVAGVLALPFMYVQGWQILLGEWNKTCDQPLKYWLLAALVVPMVMWSYQCHGVFRARRRGSLQSCTMNTLIWTGIFMYWGSITCSKDSPAIYGYVRYYSVFLLFADDTMGVFSAIILNAILTSGPGPAHAARAGLINELETVPFDRQLFSDGTENDDLEPPECSICQEEYSTETVIKRPPCGHFFHESCLGHWLEMAKTCPNCRLNLEEAVDTPAGP